MNNETTATERPPSHNEINPSLAEEGFKGKIRKIINLLKPTISNSIITFIVFLLLLAITKNLGVTLAISAGCYLIIAYSIQPILKQQLGGRLNNISFTKNAEKASTITSNSSSIILLAKGKLLTGITLLKVEWLDYYINLCSVWDFLMEEGIIIHDCREGCFLVIRKQIKILSMKNLQEQAKRLVKEIDKTILLVKRKFDIEYTDLSLHLVKGQDHIQMLLHLGLTPEKFSNNSTLSEDDIAYLRNHSNHSHQQKMEVHELLSE